MKIKFGFPISYLALLSLLTLGAAPVASLPLSIETTPVASNPLAVEFQAGFEEGVVNTWFFGDGASAIGNVVQHTYTRQGSFFVTLESDEAGITTIESFWVTAGFGAETLDFEAGLPVPSWVTVGMEATSLGRIHGLKGVLHDIVQPNPTPSCTMPVETPPDENPLEDLPRRWLLSALIDLTKTPTLSGSSFETIRVFDESQTEAIFGTRFFIQSGQWHSVGFAADGIAATRVETAPQPVGSDIVLVELEIELSQANASQGSVGLRIADWIGGQELVFEQEIALDNAHLSLDSFDFGFLSAHFPALNEDGDIKLDDFKVITDSCLPPSADELLGYWDFEDYQLGWDSSGQARHGVPMGTAAVTPGRIRLGGTQEQALDLDGAGYLEVPSLGFDFSGQSQITVEAWVKVASHSQMNLFRAQQPLAVRGNGLSVSNYTIGTGWESTFASPDPPVDQWYHLATVFDQGESLVYINGELARQRTLPFQTLQGTNYADWALGARIPGINGADQFFIGQIDDVRVFKRALNATEIRASAGLCGD